MSTVRAKISFTLIGSIENMAKNVFCIFPADTKKAVRDMLVSASNYNERDHFSNNLRTRAAIVLRSSPLKSVM